MDEKKYTLSDIIGDPQTGQIQINVQYDEDKWSCDLVHSNISHELMMTVLASVLETAAEEVTHEHTHEGHSDDSRSDCDGMIFAKKITEFFKEHKPYE